MSSRDKAIEDLHAELERTLESLKYGRPRSWNALTLEQVTSRAQVIAVRLLSAGVANPVLQRRLAEALRVADSAAIRKSLSTQARKGKDWRLRMKVCEAYFWAMESGDDERTALEAAYDAHWGRGALVNDRVPTDADYVSKRSKATTNGWKYSQIPSLAACRLAEQTIPILREEGFEMRDTGQLLKMLDLP